MNIFERIVNWLKGLGKQKVETQPKETKIEPEIVSPAPALPVGELEDLDPWMEIAESEIGVKEIVGSKHNPRILEYHSKTSLKAPDDETPWCAAFMSWVLLKAGYKSPKTARAKDFLDYGVEIKEPIFGCIVVYKRATGGHVHFYVKETADHIYGLGGNQANAVNISAYKKSDVLGYRWPVKASEIPAQVSIGGIKADWDHLSTGKEWTKIMVDAIQNHGKGMLAVPNVKDAADWAPGFAKMTQDQRMQFFVALFSSMARFESGFKPATTYTEGFNDAKGEPVVSRGLLQLSIESVNQKAYGGDVARAEYLHDVKVNLVCGVKILNHWVVNDGVIATAKLGGAQYWSVLRDSSNKKKLIQAKVAELCK